MSGEYGIAALAFVGDAVFETLVREYVLSGELPGGTAGPGRAKPAAGPDELHRRAVAFVRAEAQAAVVKAFPEDFLTPEEWDLLRRGRNKNMGTRSRSASVRDYKLATGFEALIGWLWMRDEKDRVREIVSWAIEFVEGGTKE